MHQQSVDNSFCQNSSGPCHFSGDHVGASKTKLTSSPTPWGDRSQIYEINPKLEIIRYNHTAEIFPTKTTWLNAIKAGRCNSRPWLTVDTVRTHFHESEET